MKFNLLQIISILIFLFIGCFNPVGIRLKSYTDYDKSKISDGAEIKIISFSQGKDCTSLITYYSSLIAVYGSANDTVRILSPCQVFSTKFPNGIYNSVNDSTSSIRNGLGYEILGKDEFVIVDESLPFQNGDFPVAIGQIGFVDHDNEILKEQLKKYNIDILDKMKEVAK